MESGESERGTMTRLDTGGKIKDEWGREREGSQIRAARHFFCAQVPRLARESSPLPGALFITALNRHAAKEKECSCLCTRVLASLSPAFVRLSVLRTPFRMCFTSVRRIASCRVAPRDASP